MALILRGDIEYIVHCDSKGEIIGPISKKHAHLPGIRENLTHYSTWSMVYNIKTGRYGIQLKNPKKHDYTSGGKWDMGVAGHNSYIKKDGQYVALSFEDNLIKETKEEIGVDLFMVSTKEEFLHSIKDGNEPIGFVIEKFHHKTALNNEWIGLGFIVVYDEKVDFLDDEVLDFKWYTPEEMIEFFESNDNYINPLVVAFKKAEKFRKENDL